MASNFFKIKNGENLQPQSGSTVTVEGDIAYRDDIKKIEVYGTAADNIVMEVTAAQGANRLQSKDLDAGSTKIVDPSDTSKKVA